MRRGAAGRIVPAAQAFIDRLRPGLTVASYHPVGGEADPQLLNAATQAAGCRLALPYVIDRATPMIFLAWDGGTLLPGPFGLQQLSPDAPGVTPDIILTPLVGFDRAGNRLGQGAGHYDRAFAEYPQAWRVGVAFSIQEVAQLPCDPWDVPLNAIATDTEWITPA
ncbi:5-formyltetrahydrofolate cyclo-ligase [Sphingomonas aerophila]|uniref:5-formyltetrahydrofolate cyclo-ligase n=1 Tax=Sphingomonas aerophila TaxID=1344948 RepID=UPI0031B58A34